MNKLISLIVLIVILVYPYVYQSEYDPAAPEEIITLSFELEDGTQILSQDNVLEASLKPWVNASGEQDYLAEITLDEEGKEAFARATTDHIGEQINIVVNDEIVSSPTVMQPITDGKVVITGLETYDEVSELVDTLNR